MIFNEYYNIDCNGLGILKSINLDTYTHGLSRDIVFWSDYGMSLNEA